MCSLERNKNAGNLVVRRNDSTRPSSKREKNKLLFRGTVSWGSLWERWCTWCEREMTKEAVAWITIKKKREKTKEKLKNLMLAKFYHVQDNMLGFYMLSHLILATFWNCFYYHEKQKSSLFFLSWVTCLKTWNHSHAEVFQFWLG